jgi:formamidopyrimidine-DNA glycosylase
VPELPEIETVKLQLAKYLVGERLVGVVALNPGSVQGDIEILKNKVVKGVRRRAKVLLIDWEDPSTGSGFTAAFHFKMSGQLVLEGDNFKFAGGHPTEDFVGKLPSNHTRVVFKFTKGTMYFNDQRMFGWVKVGRTEEINKMDFLEKLGPEPFDITIEDFGKRVKKSKRAIKLTIMDQEVISGVGNIYANDALWEAGIDPRTSSSNLSIDQLAILLEKIQLVLSEGIKYGGATAADAKYIDLHGLGGKYQEHFRVYDSEGKLCKRCKGVITKFVLGGRGTYVCQKCQTG